MSDKAAFVSVALFCVQRYRENSAYRWHRHYLHIYIYMATNSVTLWDYDINKLNCKKVSLQFMCYGERLSNSLFGPSEGSVT